MTSDNSHGQPQEDIFGEQIDHHHEELTGEPGWLETIRRFAHLTEWFRQEDDSFTFSQQMSRTLRLSAPEVGK